MRTCGKHRLPGPLRVSHPRGGTASAGPALGPWPAQASPPVGPRPPHAGAAHAGLHLRAFTVPPPPLPSSRVRSRHLGGGPHTGGLFQSLPLATGCVAWPGPDASCQRSVRRVGLVPGPAHSPLCPWRVSEPRGRQRPRRADHTSSPGYSLNVPVLSNLTDATMNTSPRSCEPASLTPCELSSTLFFGVSWSFMTPGVQDVGEDNAAVLAQDPHPHPHKVVLAPVASPSGLRQATGLEPAGPGARRPHQPGLPAGLTPPCTATMWTSASARP